MIVLLLVPENDLSLEVPLNMGDKTSRSHKQMTLGWSGDTQLHPAVVLMDGKQPFTEKVVLV